MEFAGRSSVAGAASRRRGEPGARQPSGKHDEAEDEDHNRRAHPGPQREIEAERRSERNAAAKAMAKYTASPPPLSTVAATPSAATQASGRRPRTANFQASNR